MAEFRDGRTYYGRVWADGEYRPPVYPSALSVRVGEPGVGVATIIGYLRAFDNNIDAVVSAWSPDLTREDVEAAIAFYESKTTDRQEIDEFLAEQAKTA